MRFLSINHLRLGASPGGIPHHMRSESRVYATSGAWARAVSLAIREQVHAVFLHGETIAEANGGLEPWGPLLDGLAQLQQAEIPVVARAEGTFDARRMAHLAPSNTVVWLDDTLDWEPPITTAIDDSSDPAVHIVAASLAESKDALAINPLTPAELDRDGAIWVLTNEQQPDVMVLENALVIEPGSIAPLSARETGRHGVWLVDTDTRQATLFPLAELEFASIAIDVSVAADIEDAERIIATALMQEAQLARADGSIATTMVIEAVLTGQTHLYVDLVALAADITATMVLEHDGMTIGLRSVEIDATPAIELEPLLQRPDPVGEVARLLHALASGNDLTDTHARLVAAAEQKLQAVSHARVFGTVAETDPTHTASTLLRRQGWATLDALVRQREID